ncbi:MCE family protein [Mycolicibacter kumamotonensis]|jgi:virulence factor Mce-like protein|uniref:MCE family protein n=3 Tax=Mycolicibacter kumamotonensis TaxID=354243 RepID=A0A1X0E7K0_9MYCO|nr:MCE family protein [Mycolicibacter kumamotonensis]NDJ88069.1 MCE family protein [Mycolicibacter kumamotonensis]ORA80569.1 MCE family protein [Mycolicibacter kumamotonensis]
MISLRSLRRSAAVAALIAVTTTGCAFGGLNSVALPGVQGRGSGAQHFTVQLANVGTLESNSPVLLSDVVIGSVGKMTVSNWHANVDIAVNPGVEVPANAVATVGQTSLLGSMHLALNPPIGQEPTGRLRSGATIPLSDSSTYPSTEQTLSSLAVLVNGGGLGQIGDIIHNFSASMAGRESDIRDLIVRLDHFTGALDRQRNNIVEAIEEMNRTATIFAGQRDTIRRALDKIPPAIDVLIKERPKFVTAMTKLGQFGDLSAGLVNDSGHQLVSDLIHIEPALRSLADIGPELNSAVAYASAFPYGPNAIERAVRGDFLNLFAVFDLTKPRLKRAMFAGTQWGDEDAKLVPAPGDPWYLNYSYDPLQEPILRSSSQDLPPGAVGSGGGG